MREFWWFFFCCNDATYSAYTSKLQTKKSHKASNMQYGPRDLHSEISPAQSDLLYTWVLKLTQRKKSRPQGTFGLKQDTANPKHTSCSSLLSVHPHKVNAVMRQHACWFHWHPILGSHLRGRSRLDHLALGYIGIKGGKEFDIILSCCQNSSKAWKFLLP